MLGDEESDVLVEPDAVVLGLLEEDRNAHLELGRLDRDREAPAEARDQAILDPRHLAREAVARDGDLLVRLEERVERIEELFLGTRLADEELHVVDEEEVERAVVALERVEALVLVGTHHVGHELLGVDVAHLGFRVALQHLGADRLQQVRLAQARAAIDEERVVGRAGILGHLDGRGARDLVGLAVHEVGECEAGVEAVLFARRTLRRRDRDRLRNHDLVVGELVVEDQVHGQAPAGDVLDPGSDPPQEVGAHVFEDVMIGRHQHQLVVLPLAPQGLDPGVVLLRRQLLLEFSGERRPKRIHGRNRGRGGVEKRGEGDPKFYRDRGRLSTAKLRAEYARAMAPGRRIRYNFRLFAVGRLEPEDRGK